RIVEVRDRYRVQVGAPWLPVILVGDEVALLPGCETLVHKRPCADRLVSLLPAGRWDVHDPPEGGNLLGEAAEGDLHGDLNRVVVDLLQPVSIDGREDRPSSQRRLWVELLLEKVDHVIGAERLAVMEGDALPQPDNPL